MLLGMPGTEMLIITFIIAVTIGSGAAPVYGNPAVEGAKNNPVGTQDATSYYGWIDKFERQDGRPDRVGRGAQNVPFAAAEEAKPKLVTEGVSAEGVAAPQTVFGDQTGSDRKSTAEPGEGLGCYYHQAYYSHLPMFKDDIYSLRGSLDVSETFHKSAAVAASAPIEDTPGP